MSQASSHNSASAAPGPSPTTAGDLLALLRRFVGHETAASAFAQLRTMRGGAAIVSEETATPEMCEVTERVLGGVVGEHASRVIMDSLLEQRALPIDELVNLLSAKTHQIEFNRTLLRATLEHLSQGVSVVDRNLRLIAWNQGYIDLFKYPAGFITLGRPIEDVIQYNAQRGLLGPGAFTDKITRRIGYMQQGQAYQHERELPDGTVIEIRGNPMPDGGFVTSYLDVTAYKRAQHELEVINETLESRVTERTAELTEANEALQEAKLEAERANQAKTRFLASASHDLVQPLNAARLFVSAIDRRGLNETTERLIGQVESSLTAAESLLGALLDITRLDAAAQELRSEHVELSRVLGPLAAEFSVLARARGLEFRVVPSHAIVHTDPRLLRRVLQNFLSNAVRYTRKGRVLIGCRRQRGALRIEVWDTGPGIPPDKQTEIFEEFRRLDSQDGVERGLGLGLAIAERLARLLDHPLGLRSCVGKGSAFSITVPLGDPKQVVAAQPTVIRRGADGISDARVLCLDNEPAVLGGMEALLSGWGCKVIAVRDEEAALRHYREHGQVPDLALVDYHLDEGIDGIDTLEKLKAVWGVNVPGIVITADHTQQAKQHAEQRGYALLPKPVKPAGLRALMGRILVAQKNESR
jgi:signal transduction histidine kinase/PAS domain-containing protein